MGAALGDAAGVDHADAIGVLHGGEAVGDDQRGAALHEPLERLLDQVLALGVEGAGGLVEDEDARVLEDGAGDGHPLLLPAGELHAALADERRVALGEALDEVVRVGGARGGLDLRVGGPGAPVADVVGDAAAEEDGLLRDHADAAPQAVGRDLPQVVAVDEDAAAVGIVEAREERREGGLARARGADQRHHLAGADRRDRRP